VLAAVLSVAVHAAARAAEDYGALFDELCVTVETHFLDPDLRGVDWDALRRRHRPRAAAADSLDAFGAVANDLLAVLETSHTRLLTEREPAYFELLSIFSTTLEEEIRAAHPDNPGLAYPGIGVLTASINGETFVRAALPGWPAADAGLRRGDRIVAADGAPFHPIGSFEGRIGAPVALTVQGGPDPADRRTVTVTPVLVDPAELYVRAAAGSIDVVRRGDARVGYIHLWSAAGPTFENLLRDALADEPLLDADALVLDLRDGWGGANPDWLNLFNPRVPRFTFRDREGVETVVDTQWRRPVVLLVNDGSRSGKEILAHGFRMHGIGPVVGGRTAGAVVGGRPFLLRPGVLLYLAVLDVTVEGERLEGRGVEPDVAVAAPLPYAQGADPRRERALDVAAELAAGVTPASGRPAGPPPARR
jgi:carboxyl-terminal processing protease